MNTDTVLWRMRHREHDVEVVGELRDGRMHITIGGDEMQFDDDPQFRRALELAPRHLSLPCAFDLLMTQIPQAFALIGFRMEGA